MTYPKSRRFHGLISTIGALGAVLLGVIGLVGLASLRPEPEQLSPPQKKYNVDVFVVEENCLRETISGFGTALPDHEVTLSAQVAGEVQNNPLEIGHAVSKDQPILQIDPRIYQQRHEQVQAQLEEGESELRRLKQEQANAARLLKQARADLEVAAQQYERRKSLQSREIVTPDELARSLLDYRRYEEAVIQQENEAELYPLRIDQVEKRQATTRTELELARLDVLHTEVVPPFDGVVAEVYAETGQYVRVGDPLIRITKTESVEIPIALKLSDYAKLQPLLAAGEHPQAELALDVTQPAQWTGLLTRTAPQANRENRTIEVFVEVDNTTQSTPLLPGTFLHARIEGPLRENVLAIPREALINNHVLIANPHSETPVIQRPIEPRQTLQNLALCDAGLKAGDLLILTNLDVLYRDPAEKSVEGGQSAPELSINRTLHLKDVLSRQEWDQVQIMNCPADEAVKDRSRNH